jgi:hypothetical protein
MSNYYNQREFIDQLTKHNEVYPKISKRQYLIWVMKIAMQELANGDLDSAQLDQATENFEDWMRSRTWRKRQNKT